MNDERLSSYFTHHVYGAPPLGTAVQASWHLLEEGDSPEGALRRQMRLDWTAPTGHRVRLTLMVHLPHDALQAGPVPAFLGLNFRGNHACTDDVRVLDPTADPSSGDPLHLGEAPRPIRGEQAHRWPLDLIVSHGWASVTACYLQLGPDSPALFESPLPRLFSSHSLAERDPDEWGAISIWAWALSRVLDALVAGMVPEIDATRVVVHGHSRLGKAAIWAVACDSRFAAVISNESGCLGAALGDNRYETPEDLRQQFPHWVAQGFGDVLPRWARVIDGHADPDLPDQPDLLSSIAPRPLYVSSASADVYADPEAEFLAWQRAAGAWPGGSEATVGSYPRPGERYAPPDVPLGYHLRDGTHDVTRFDWSGWLDFVNRWVRDDALR